MISDRVVLMKNGNITADGKPCDILTDNELMSSAGLDVPMPVRMYYDLAERGKKKKKCPLTAEELVGELCRLN